MARRNKYVQEKEPENVMRKRLVPKNKSQELYIESLRSTPITISIGPAGSGKSFLSAGVAMEKFLNGDVDRILITRPVVEAGEHLGFLPGTFFEKIQPYLLPLLDSFHDHIGEKYVSAMLENGQIEIAPLAFMRGRTFNNCLSGDQTVLLSDGTEIRIDLLVQKFLSGESIEVKSYNLETNDIEDSQISFAFKKSNSENLLQFTLADGTILKVTKDHKLYVKNKGYIEAQFISDQDELLKIE